MSEAGAAVTALLKSWQGGNRAALDQITEQLYAQLRSVAGMHLAGERSGHTLRPTALVHEAYLRMQGKPFAAVGDRKHFLAIASRVMRCVLVDHARARKRVKRDAGEQITLEEFSAVASSGVGILEIDAALEKLAAHDGRKVRVIELVCFGGATYAEAAEVLEISDATLHRDLKMARAWLKLELQGMK